VAHAKKLSRKELKKPDEFVQSGQKFMQWATDNARQVMLGVGGIVAIGVIVAVASWWMETQAVAAGAALGDAIDLSERPIATEGEATPVPETGVPAEENFKSEEAKTASIEAALEKVVSDYPGTPAAALAETRLGDFAFKKGDFDRALTRYEAVVKVAAENSGVLYSALEGIGLCHEAKGEGEAALKAYEALETGAPFMAPFALVEQARVLEALGRKDEARVRASRVVEEFAESSARSDADKIISRLPAPPVAAAAPTEVAAAAGGVTGTSDTILPKDKETKLPTDQADGR